MQYLELCTYVNKFLSCKFILTYYYTHGKIIYFQITNILHTFSYIYST